MGDRGEESGGGGGARSWVLATAAAVVVLAVTAVVLELTHSLAVERQVGAEHEAIARVAVGLGADLRARADALEVTASGLAVAATQLGALPPRAAEALPPTAVLVTVDERLSAEGRGLQEADLARPEVAAALAQARDAGGLVSAGAVELAAGPRFVLATPVYRQPGRTAEERRAALLAWVVDVVDLGEVAADQLDEGEGVRVTVGPATFPTPRSPRAGAPTQKLPLRGVPISIQAGSVDAVPLGSTASAIGLAGLIGAVLAGLGTRLVWGRFTAQSREIARAGAQAELIAQVAPVAQQSLDLGEVLPAVAIQLADGFGLRGMQLSTGGRQGQVELFSLGERPTEAVVPRLSPPAELGPGESFALALERGGRSVARLQVTAGRRLDSADLGALAILAELVTGAVINASLYASEQDAVRRLRDLDALKTVFLSTASHELRTPVTAISGFASLLVDGWERFPEDQRQELLGRIAANARSLVAVVQDLLDFSLLDRQAQPLPVEAVDLAALCQGVVDRLDPLFSDHRIVVRSAETPPVAGERNALERVVTNLLTNAAKYSPSGTTISVEVASAGGGAEVAVSDEGPGVPDDEKSRIFTRFYRGTHDAVMKTRGVGIGLSVVAELVERLGGAVSVEDGEAGGARFLVWLPGWGDGRTGATSEREVEDAPTA